VITLLTGNPRSGKTAQLVEWLRTIYKDRPIYMQGLEGLTLPHEKVDATRWHLDVPDGSIIVIDEVQQVWRPRGPGHLPHASIMELETHGHRGIDFFLTTQKPSLVDKNVRELVGRHLHIRDTGWLGRWVYEWPECSENLAWKTCALKRRFKVPKSSFAHYKSASMHSTVEKARSLMPVVTGGLVLLALVLVFLVYRAVSSKVKKAEPAHAAQVVTEAAPAVEGRGHRQASVEPVVYQWPVYEASAAQKIADPYHGRGLQIEGQWSIGGEVFAVFGVVIDGQRVATATLKSVTAMGYAWTDLGPCAGVLRFGAVQRLVTCAMPRAAERGRFDERAAAPAPAASGAASIFGRT